MPPRLLPPGGEDVLRCEVGEVRRRSKIKIIKKVRTLTSLGLKEAKELVEKAPIVLKSGVAKEESSRSGNPWAPQL